jgi:hypothetical protein
MKTLYDLFQSDARAMRDATLPEEAYRQVLAGAIETFKEQSIRDAFPVEVLNVGPGALESRVMKLIDMAEAQHGMKGSGGQFDRVNYAIDDQPFYPIWANVEVPEREQAASVLGGVGLNLLADSGRNAGAIVTESENKLLIKGLGPVKGLTSAPGIQTFAGASWATQGNAYKDLIKAIKVLRDKKVPTQKLAVLANPAEDQNLWQTFASTSVAQRQQLESFFPGGIRACTEIPAGEVYVYAKTPTVLRVRVAQELSAIPLPRVDLGDRMMVRVIPTTHFSRPEGIVKITNTA